MSVHGSRGGGKNAESQVSISLPLHGSLHLLHHPTRNCKGLHLVHPDVRAVPVTVITTHTPSVTIPNGHVYTLLPWKHTKMDLLVFISVGQVLNVLFDQQVRLRENHKRH